MQQIAWAKDPTGQHSDADGQQLYKSDGDVDDWTILATQKQISSPNASLETQSSIQQCEVFWKCMLNTTCSDIWL